MVAKPGKIRQMPLSFGLLKVSSGTFDWLDRVQARKLVLQLVKHEDYMAFKYARDISESIELLQEIDSEQSFLQKVVA